ncbi:hypothetical protein [Meiothermus sp. CFH 77666]|uniref:hypothetical protein n=1 Tax=Meiothermus sp. CFH 77666 TaxID=2817942 RepID=UPI001AA09EE6|nr:hypothetical protein [Meiothermus sp. CFH 77666]MBO1438496.1 hypothetical protein [Meiothermus sp. CFH 77666]
MDEDESKREYRLIVQPPDETHPWQARLERAGEVLEFESPLELVAWLEANFEHEGLR